MIQDFQSYKEQLNRLPFGKKVGQNLYLYFEDIEIENEILHRFIEHIKDSLPGKPAFNIVKFFLNAFKISLLHYPDFWTDLHPALESAHTIELDTGKTRRISYKGKGNPPILHRKETLISPAREEHPLFQRQTETEEAYGLFNNPKQIGFKRQWEELLHSKGIIISGNIVSKRETTESSPVSEQINEPNNIDRHKTAISRSNFSKPVQILLQYDQLKDSDTFFDYGCGLGDDIRALQINGINASGWDPIHLPDAEKKTANVVNSHY